MSSIPANKTKLMPVFVRNAKADDRALDARVAELAKQNNGMMVSAKLNDPSGPKMHTEVLKRLTERTMNADRSKSDLAPGPASKT